MTIISPAADDCVRELRGGLATCSGSMRKSEVAYVTSVRGEEGEDTLADGPSSPSTSSCPSSSAAGSEGSVWTSTLDLSDASVWISLCCLVFSFGGGST